jgi:prepilin-type N-terminal cleavage/methylation domain-containing protein
MNRNIKKASKGFTLLEILLVIAAIGILAAIVLVAINPNRQINQARQAVINSEKNTIEKALQQRLIDTGSYPTLIDGVQRKICSNTVATPDCINITTDLEPTYIAAIPSSTIYTVARGNDGRIYVNTAETAANLVCPTGYIGVPGNSMYGTSDFCVMKYEAKTGSATVAATTQAAGNPQVNISQTNAITACSLNGAGYGLINNNEWMTIARNIEAQGVNWTGGAVGSGGLWRGHSDNNPANALAASTDDNLGYEGTGNVSPSIEKRTHTLSNGEVIWDISGNAWEWTSDTIQGQNKPNNSSGNLWQQWTAISNFGTLSYDLTRPSNTSWNSTQNMGQYYAGGVTGTTTFAFLRGGYWSRSAAAGVFALDLEVTPSFTFSALGFRCVLR